MTLSPSHKLPSHDLAWSRFAASHSTQLPPIVCLPGWGHSALNMATLASALSDYTEVRVVDLPGIGANKNHGWHGFVEQLLSQLPAQFFLLGWSLGGMIATEIAQRYPGRVLALVTMASNAKFVAAKDWPNAMSEPAYKQFCQDFEQNPEQSLKHFISLQALGDTQRARIHQALRAELVVPDECAKFHWQEGLALLNRFDHRAFHRQPTVPVLRLFGEHDKLVPATVSTQLCSGTNQVIAAAAHALHLSAPETVRHAVVNFFSALPKLPERDKKKVGLSFGRASSTYDEHALLQRAIAKKVMTEYLPRREGGLCVDIGCGTGFLADFILPHQRYLGLDLSYGMLATAKSKLPRRRAAWVQADMDNFPLASDSVSTIVSSFSLQWSEQPERVISECYRVLKKEGVFCFSTVGPATLYELRQAWAQVDGYTHVNDFNSAQVLQQQLCVTGFSIEQVKTEQHCLYYPDVMSLMRELKVIGAHNMNRQQNRGLTGRKRLNQLADAYESFRREHGLPASYEVIFFVAKVNKEGK